MDRETLRVKKLGDTFNTGYDLFSKTYRSITDDEIILTIYEKCNVVKFQDAGGINFILPISKVLVFENKDNYYLTTVDIAEELDETNPNKYSRFN